MALPLHLKLMFDENETRSETQLLLYKWGLAQAKRDTAHHATFVVSI